MSLIPTKPNYETAARRMAAFSIAATKNGRSEDSALLELAAHACIECAEYAPESVATAPAPMFQQEVQARPASQSQPVTSNLQPVTSSVVCCICDSPGIFLPKCNGYTCTNPACPRYGVPLPRRTFIGFEDSTNHEPVTGNHEPSETRQDRAGALPAANVHSPV